MHEWSLRSMFLPPHNAFFGGVPCTRVDRYQAPHPRLSICGWLVALVCEALWHWVVKEVCQVFSLSNNTESAAASMLKQCAPVPCRLVERCARLS